MVLLEAIIIGGLIKKKIITIPEPMLRMKNDFNNALKENAKAFVRWI